MKTILGDVNLSDVCVSRDTTFAEAADALVMSPAAVIAVVDDKHRVVGLFGAEEALAGVLPGYLGDLRHTAFTKDDAALLAETAAGVRDEPVERYAVQPVSVSVDTSALHVGAVFLHTALPAIAVVENDRFVGVLDQAEFVRAMLRRAARADA